MTQATIIQQGNALLYTSPYHPSLIAALKTAIPASDRVWDGETKAWKVAATHLETLQALTRRFLGHDPKVTTSNACEPVQQVSTRLLDVRYIGGCKVRADGTVTAFGWYGGGWNLIFPAKVLRDWFGDLTRPDEAATYYQALGLAPGAPGTEVKKAWKRLARQWHPDTCREPDAAYQFRKLQEAYEIISDPIKRAKYDAGIALERIYQNQLADLAAKQGPQQRVALPETEQPRPAITYRSPMRCGYILADVDTKLSGKLEVRRILAWEDIVDADGRILVTGWPEGADKFVEEWVR